MNGVLAQSAETTNVCCAITPMIPGIMITALYVFKPVDTMKTNTKQRQLFYEIADARFLSRFEDQNFALEILKSIRNELQNGTITTDAMFFKRFSAMHRCAPSYIDEVISVALEFGLIGEIKSAALLACR